MNPKSLEQLKNFLKTVEEGISKKDFAYAFEVFLKVLKEMKNTVEANLDNTIQTVNFNLENKLKDIEEIESKIKDINDRIQEENTIEVEELRRLLDAKMIELEAMIPTINLAPIERKIDEAIKTLESKIPELPKEITAEDIKNKIISLKESGWLDREAIKGLNDLYDRLKKLEELPKNTPVIASLTRGAANKTYTKFHGGASNITVSATAPTNPELNDLWYDIS